MKKSLGVIRNKYESFQTFKNTLSRKKNMYILVFTQF